MRSSPFALGWATTCGVAGCQLVVITLACASLGCVEGRVAAIEQGFRSLQQAQHEQGKRVEQLNNELGLAWSTLFCGDVLKQLLEDVESECGQAPASATSPSRLDSDEEKDYTGAGKACKEADIAPALREADQKGRLLDVMRRAAREIVPIVDGSGVSDFRQKRLIRLTAERYHTTRFILVARRTSKEKDDVGAQERLALVVKELKSLRVEDDRIRQWRLNFTMSKQERDDYRQLRHTGEPDDVDRGVWVFRVNC